MQFIDIHGHYAWGIDDGMPSLEDCKLALQKAKEQGIIALIATPHVIPGTTSKEELEKIKNRIQDLKVLAKDYDIKVMAGCELFLNHDYLEALEQKIYIPIEGTKYLLMEFDVRKELGDEEEVEDRLYEISCSGMKPVVAHVERYFHDKIDLDRVQNFMDEGYVIQVNTSSILGLHGKTIQKNAMKLLENGMVHCIATDTHRAEGKRVPNLLDVYETLKNQIDPDTLDLLMFRNPAHLLLNEEVEDMPKTVKKESFFGKLFKKK